MACCLVGLAQPVDEAGRGGNSRASTPAAPTAIPEADGVADCRRRGDFVLFRGRTYLPAGNQSVATADLGAEVGAVTGGTLVNDSRRWCDTGPTLPNPDAPCEDGPHGLAPALLNGSPIYAVGTYATTFRLAGERDGQHALYQVVCHFEADVGADIFDINGRIDHLSTRPRDGGNWIDVDDPVTVEALVAMVLRAPVIDQDAGSPSSTHEVVVHLDDGTAVFWYSAPGRIYFGGVDALVVPAEFSKTLDVAISTG
jgi:hypothetical protein